MLPELKKKAEETGEQTDIQAVNDMASAIDRFEKKIYDLKTTRIISIQMAPQIRLIQNNDSLLVEKIQSSLINTIPLWKNQIVIALGVVNAKSALNVQKSVTDTTNDMLKKNSEMLKRGTIEVAEEAEKSIVNVETLQQTNKDIIETLDKVLEIQANGRVKRLEAEKELVNIEEVEVAKESSITGLTFVITGDLNKFSNREELKEKIDNLKDEVIKLSNSHSSYDIELMSKKDRVKEVGLSINQNQSTLIEITKSIEKIDADIRILKERKKYTEEHKDERSLNIINIKETILKLETNMNELKNEISLSTEEYNSKKKYYDEKNSKYQNFLNNKNMYTRRLEQKQLEETELKYKIDYLTNSINNSDSIPRSVKSIMSNFRLDGVHNIIGKLISYDEEYYRAITTSLGGASNYLVVDTSNTAKEMVKYLKENKLGRATFYPISVITGRSISPDVLQILNNCDGYIAIASDIVSYDNKYTDIISNVLGNVIIVNDIDTANSISIKINKRYKIVTLDGQVVNVGGSLTGGTKDKINNPLSIKYEIEEIIKKSDLLNQKNKDINKEINDIYKINNYN